MMKFKLIGTAIALSLSTVALAADAECCCKGKEAKAGCCVDMKGDGKSDPKQDMSGMKH